MHPCPSSPLLSCLTPLQFLVPLALLLPVAAALAGTSLCLPRSSGSAHVKPGRTNTGASGSVLRLLVCVAPVFVWGAAITALPHKEERFLYVVYPLVSSRHRPVAKHGLLQLDWGGVRA
jgi:hypothetical protein